MKNDKKTGPNFSREENYVSEIRELLDDVFECMHCDTLGLAFRRQADGRFFRFPPVIGAAGDVSVLFIGINPRISPPNEGLHQRITNDMCAFADLAANKKINGNPYIAIDGEERHYRLHARMIDNLFPNRLFEEVAAATELYFCASADASGIDRDDNPCAEKFMDRVFLLMRPRAVVAVGGPVKNYLRRFICGPSNDQLFVVRIGGHTTTVVPVPHPNARGERLEKWRWATDAVASVLEGKPIGGGSALTAVTLQVGINRERTYSGFASGTSVTGGSPFNDRQISTLSRLYRTLGSSFI
jgi:hypothetical protein